MSYTYNSMPIPVAKYGLKGVRPMTPKLWVIHNTSNTAAAWNEASYMTNNNNVEAFHYVVDESEIYQTLGTDQTCNHAPGYNDRGIGIEIARSAKGQTHPEYVQAEQNAIDFIARDMIERGWNPYDNMDFHRHASHSNTACPQNIPVSREAWFRNAIAEKMKEIGGGSVKPNPKPEPKPEPTPSEVEIVAETGNTFYPNQLIYMRDNPGLNAKIVDTTDKGDYITYNAYAVVDGYVWIRSEMSGKWTPWRVNGGEKYGEIKSTSSKPQPAQKPAPTGIVKESGTFYPNQAVIMRNEPSTSATHVDTAYAGDYITYDSYKVAGGYVWLHSASSGNWIPWRVNGGEKYGEIR